MVDVMPEVFDAIYNAVTAEYPSADLSSDYVAQPASFPHVQVWDESNTVSSSGMNLSGDECFSSIVIHVEIFDNTLNGKMIVDSISRIVSKTMLHLGYTRSYSSPVPNYENASIARRVERYRRIQPN